MQYLYVCLFSNGHIKVGRSINPESRIAAHADRVSCMGVELVEHRTFACSGHVIPAEAELIDFCARKASKVNKNEWFVGVDFLDACEVAEAASAKAREPQQIAMSKQFQPDDERIINHYGGPAAFAKVLGLESKHATQRVSNWIRRGIPPSVRVQHRKLFDAADRALSKKAEA